MKTLQSYSINKNILEEFELLKISKETMFFLAKINGIIYYDYNSFKEILEKNIRDKNEIKIILKLSKRIRFLRIIKQITNLRDKYLPNSVIYLNIVNYILISPILIFLRLRIRFFIFKLIAKIKNRNLISELNNTNKNGFEHNFKQLLIFTSGHRNRTERVMNVLRSVEDYNFKETKLLVVGSRNEAELMLLQAYGFKNITAVDLFSYSPKIEVMDMNYLQYPDNFFDIYYSSYVIRYSPDIIKTISEAIRVTKNNGLLIFSFTYGNKSEVVPNGSELNGGGQELIGLIGKNLSHIYWNEDFRVHNSEKRSVIIVKIIKD